MAKATGKKPTENTYSLLFDQEGEGSKSAKGKKVDPVPAVEESKKVAEKQQPPKKQPSKVAEPTATAAPATDAAAPKSKLNREEWEKNKGQIQQEINDGFQPVARPPKQNNNQQSAQTGQNYGGQENFRGGRGGGEYRGGRRGRGGDYQGGRGGDYQGGRGGEYQGGRGGDYQGGRGGYYQGGRGGDYQGGRGGDYQGGRGGEYQGGRGGEYQGGRGGDYQGGQGEYQGGGRRGGGDYRGGRRGRGGRGRNPNRNLEDQPAVEENSNRDVNQRGEDLTGDKTPRKRQNDRRSGRFVKNYGNNNTGPEFAPPEWTSANAPENAPATTEPTTTAEGWGDTAATATEESAAWDAINQATAQTAPAQVQTADTKSAKKPEKPKPVPQKGLDDYLGEKEKKKQELADLLASKGVNVPTPKAPAVVEEPKPTKTKQPAKPSGAAPETLFFNFEANRSPRFNQDSDLPDDPPPGYENTSRGRGGRRGGRGGRFQGGRYNRNNNYGETAAAVVAAQPTQYYDASSVAREDEWPSLI